ncbi:serine/threonine-protein kinase [Nocardioides sp. GCM10027113]|uniref:serine/threonine-protein kinase n=1 Tax=unclassified Nocardioides TaxID=2615069 RepID=UPI00361EBB16
MTDTGDVPGLEPGQMIGPYRVVRTIGAGGMGVVLEAYDVALDRRVALKVISPHLAHDRDFRDRFQREAQAMASLDSGHVVHVYAHGEVDGRLYLATQLVSDGDLGALLESVGPQPVRVALELVAQVASGLADAHEAGLAHRDIKPSNVLLRRRPHGLHAYLGDFGLARPVDGDPDRTRTRYAAGTPAYMAPELHTGGRAGVASDLYSVGCLLWTTLTGRPPYPGGTDFEVVSAHVGRPVPQLPGSSPLVAEVNRLLRATMSKDPAARPESAAALAADLRRAPALSDEPADGRDEPRLLPGRGSRAAAVSRPVAAAVGAAALLAALAVVGAGLVLDDRAGPGPTGPSGSIRSDGAVRSDGADDGAGSGSPPRGGSGGHAPTGPAATEAAQASLTRALEDEGLLTGDQARCTAREWLRGAGLAAMLDAGFFDEDLGFVDQSPQAMTPAIERAATAAARICS